MTVAMRKLKPEVDALNLRFKNDPQQKSMALMELYRKNNVNVFRRLPPAARADARLVRDVYDAPDGGRNVPHQVSVVHRPLGPGCLLYPPGWFSASS